MRKKSRMSSLKEELTLRTPTCNENLKRDGLRNKKRRTSKNQKTKLRRRLIERSCDGQRIGKTFTSFRWNFNKENNKTRNNEKDPRSKNKNEQANKSFKISKPAKKQQLNRIKHSILEKFSSLHKDQLKSFKNLSRFNSSFNNLNKGFTEETGEPNPGVKRILKQQSSRQSERLQMLNKSGCLSSQGFPRCVQRSIYNKTFKELGQIRECSRKRVKKTRDLSIVNEAGIDSQHSQHAHHLPHSNLRLPARKYIKAEISREVSMRSRMTCTSEFQMPRDLTEVSFFNIERGVKESEILRNFWKKGAGPRGSPDSPEFEEVSDYGLKRMGRKRTTQNKLPKIQKESSLSFVKTVFNKWVDFIIKTSYI